MPKRQPLDVSARGLFIVVSVLVLALAGCGASSSKSKHSATQAASISSATTANTITPPHAGAPALGTAGTAPRPESVPNLKISSPVFQAGRPIGGKERAIPALYTCDGADTSPPISWKGVPAGTVQLFLVIFDLAGSSTGVYFNWAVADLEPTLHGIPAGKLPAGAIVGRNSLGQSRYSICPPRGQPHHFGIILYALNAPLHVRPGFDATKTYEAIQHSYVAEGHGGFAYQRR